MNGTAFMTGVLRVKFRLVLNSALIPAAALACAVASPALAEAEAAASPDQDPATQITVVGTGFSQPLESTGQSIAVIGRPEIEALQGGDITRVLERLPGVVFSRNGGPGGYTGVRVRGAESEQTLVLVDGVRLDDPSQPSGGTNFGNLLAGNLEKVELLRGSNSVVWGSDAIGGVIALTTRQLEGADLSAEYGAYHTFTGTVAVGGRTGAAQGTLAAGYTESRGFSEAAGDPEPDGFRQVEVTGKGSVELGGGFNASLHGRFADSRRVIDAFGMTSDDVQYTRDASAAAGLGWSGPDLELKATGAVYDIHRHYTGSDLGGLFFQGRTWRAALDGRWQATPAVALIFGTANDWSRFRDASNPLKTASQADAHALVDFHAGRLNLAAGLRYDHHDAFGGAWTTGVNGSFEVLPGWRVRASFGEGFKAPTLYQLNAFGDDYGYLFSGNPQLKPERSRSYDAGIEYGTRDGDLHFAATVFRRDTRNLIAFVGCDTSTAGICADHPGDFMVSTYANVGKARAEGVELEADARPVETLGLHLAYSYVHSFNRTPGDYLEGRDLARRPRNALTAAVDWRSPLHDLSLGADVRLVSDSYDSQYSNLKLDGYAVATVRASLPVTAGLELYGRIENVTNAHYQTVAGYNTAGRSAYVGARLRI